MSEHAEPGADKPQPQRYYRLTGRGKVRAASSEPDTVVSLHMQDLLRMCGAGIRLDELRQFMPPRSLQAALESLLSLGLVEPVPPRDAVVLAASQAMRSAWNGPALGQLQAA